MSEESKAKHVKIVVQQCLSATLRLPTDEVLKMERPGMVVFVCFHQGATAEHAVKAAESVGKAKLSESESQPKRVSILELPGDVMVIPQATLGGKLKGKNIQYHGNVDKNAGECLYESFCEKLRELFGSGSKTLESGCKVFCGVYGARQVLGMDTNGPYTHVFEL